MLLIFDIACLVITLFACMHYVVTGFYSRPHRLLPLVYGLVTVYEFFIVVESIYGDNIAIDTLKALMLIQFLTLLLYYIADFMQYRMPIWVNFILFNLMNLADIAELARGKWGIYSRYIILTYFIGMVILNIAVATYAIFHHIYTKQVRFLHRWLYLAIIIAGVGLMLVTVGNSPEAVVMPLCLTISCSMLNYLVSSDRMRDTDTILKEDLFANLDTIMLLFDADCFYLDSNLYTKKRHPELVQIAESDRENYPFHELVAEWAKTLEKNAVVALNEHFYKVQMQDVFYKKKLRGYILTLSDVTNEQEAVDDANRLTREKSDFLANISHDLRSPLHAIIGGTDIILLRDDMSHRSRHMVQQIREAGNRLLGLVNSVLEFSKLEAGGLELQEAEYHLDSALRAYADECLVTLGTRPVDFRISTTTAFPKRMVGDRIRVLEVLQNLVSNSLKYTEEGFIHCDLSCEKLENNRIKVEVKVSDTGLGIPEEVLSTIFEAYTSYGNVYAREGTGLGLNIVARLCEVMDGYVKAESEFGKGSVFTAVFYQKYLGEEWDEPYYFDRNRQYDTAFVSQTLHPNWVYPKARVLLADDLKVNREIVAELMKSWKLQVDEAEDGKQAVACAREEAYDLIVLDQMMPVMSGIEAADEIAGFSDTPMVMMTADISDQMRRNSEIHGFAGYLTKPLDLEQLQKTIERLLPVDKRELPADDSFAEYGGALHGQMYTLSLAAFVEELKELYPILPEYAHTDMQLFRTKVHGVKGVSRQLGRFHLGDLSEVMEMAAKAGHEAFIEKNVSNYVEEIKIAIDEAEFELNSK